MKLNLETPTGVHLVRSYAADHVRIGEKTLHAPCLVDARELIEGWTRKDVASLAIEDVAAIFERQPEILIVGTPTPVPLLAMELRAAFGRKRIGAEVMELGAACRTYNVLVQEERRVMAALFPGRDSPGEDTGRKARPSATVRS